MAPEIRGVAGNVFLALLCRGGGVVPGGRGRRFRRLQGRERREQGNGRFVVRDLSVRRLGEGAGGKGSSLRLDYKRHVGSAGFSLSFGFTRRRALAIRNSLKAGLRTLGSVRSAAPR